MRPAWPVEIQSQVNRPLQEFITSVTKLMALIPLLLLGGNIKAGLPVCRLSGPSDQRVFSRIQFQDKGRKHVHLSDFDTALYHSQSGISTISRRPHTCRHSSRPYTGSL